MVMRATISALAAAAKAPRGGSLRLFSTTSTISSSFPFPQNTQQTPAREQAEPNTNLFVSGKCPFLYVSYSCSHFLVIITGLVLSLWCWKVKETLKFHEIWLILFFRNEDSLVIFCVVHLVMSSVISIVVFFWLRVNWKDVLLTTLIVEGRCFLL